MKHHSSNEGFFLVTHDFLPESKAGDKTVTSSRNYNITGSGMAWGNFPWRPIFSDEIQQLKIKITFSFRPMFSPLAFFLNQNILSGTGCLLKFSLLSNSAGHSLSSEHWQMRAVSTSFLLLMMSINMFCGETDFGNSMVFFYVH